MFGFSDLEDRFMGSEGVSALRAALASVRAVADEVRLGIASGLPKEDFARAEKILAATRAAEDILLNAANRKGT